MIVVIDNYDSFTFNLVHVIELAGFEVTVKRNDAISVSETLQLADQAIVISPGPGRPEESGICSELVSEAAGRRPVLGICLGMQIIAQAFGGEVVPARTLVHGKASSIRHARRGVFSRLPNPTTAMRYHSLVVRRRTLPEHLEVTAWVEDEPDTVMGLRHRRLPIEGVQFHPESFMTPHGPELVSTFLQEMVR